MKHSSHNYLWCTFSPDAQLLLRSAPQPRRLTSPCDPWRSPQWSSEEARRSWSVAPVLRPWQRSPGGGGGCCWWTLRGRRLFATLVTPPTWRLWRVCAAAQRALAGFVGKCGLVPSKQVFFLAKQKNRCQFSWKIAPCPVLGVSIWTRWSAQRGLPPKRTVPTLSALQDTPSDEGGAEIWLDAVGGKPVQKSNHSIDGREAGRPIHIMLRRACNCSTDPPHNRDVEVSLYKLLNGSWKFTEDSVYLTNEVNEEEWVNENKANRMIVEPLEVTGLYLK